MSSDIKENLFEYVNASKPEHVDILECLELEIHERVYYYGAQFKRGRDSNKFLSSFWFFYKHFKILVYLLITKKNANQNFKGSRGLSAATMNYDEMVETEKVTIDRTPWSVRLRRPLNMPFSSYIEFMKIDYRINFYNFHDLISVQNIESIRRFKKLFEDFIKHNNYQFLLVPEDLNFWPRLSIQVFNELGLPSICMAHGGTSMLYEGFTDSKLSHLTMWGNLQAEFHIKHGYNPTKISVTGHPHYLFKHTNLKFAFDNILVIPKTMAGVTITKKKFVEDRGNGIMYLLIIERVLKDLGIKSVSFRPHPSENYDWYSKFIDTNFFREDKKVLSASLKLSTLVIGPKSTTLIDAIAHGVNYVIFEPVLDGKDILSGIVTPPFDGSDPDFPTATNSLELNNILEKKMGINMSALTKILKLPPDLSFIRRFVYDN